MKNNTKIELIYEEEKLIPIRIGYSLGTVYNAESDDINYTLYNVGYNPINKSIYYNKNVHLPKKIIKYFENSIMTDELIKEMNSIGIINKRTVDLMYYEAKNVNHTPNDVFILKLKNTFK